MADHMDPEVETRSVPDYPLEEKLKLDAAQLKLLLDPTRIEIIDLLTERAATTSQLADALEKPKGTVGHHCKALEQAGLIHVVRTAKVRAIEERYYGRIARLFLLSSITDAGVMLGTFLDRSYEQLVDSAHDKTPGRAHLSTARYARIPADRASEWEERLGALADEFASQPRGGDVTYGLLVGLFQTERRPLSD